MENVIIRALGTDDAEPLATLTESLGYCVSADKLRSRIEVLASSPSRIALVAVVQDVVIAWIDAAVEEHLQSEPVVTIGGLVVRDDMRGRRIGQRLCQAVEDWAAQMGVAIVRVRSQQKRADAHRFYLREGYAQAKLSVVFEKHVAR